MDADVRVDYSGWEQKSFRVKIVIADLVRQMVDYGISVMNDRVTENLAGERHPAGTPSPSPGELPVTQISGNLHNSVRTKRLNTVLGMVFIDSAKAPYAYLVHFGSVNGRSGYIMPPRPYMKMASIEVREIVYNWWWINFKKRVREVGWDSAGF